MIIHEFDAKVIMSYIMKFSIYCTSIVQYQYSFIFFTKEMFEIIYLLLLTYIGFQNWTTRILAFDFERMKGAKKRTTNENRWMHDGKLPKLSVIRSRSKWKIFSCKLVSIYFVVIVLVVACAEIILNTSHAHFLWFKLSWISKKQIICHDNVWKIKILF